MNKIISKEFQKVKIPHGTFGAMLSRITFALWGSQKEKIERKDQKNYLKK